MHAFRRPNKLKRKHDHLPSKFGQGTSKPQMVHCFFPAGKHRLSISMPTSPQQVVLGQHTVLHQQPDEDFDREGGFDVQIPLYCTTAEAVNCIYRDLTVNTPVFPIVHLTESGSELNTTLSTISCSCSHWSIVSPTNLLLSWIQPRPSVLTLCRVISLEKVIRNSLGKVEAKGT